MAFCATVALALEPLVTKSYYASFAKGRAGWTKGSSPTGWMIRRVRMKIKITREQMVEFVKRDRANMQYNIKHGHAPEGHWGQLAIIDAILAALEENKKLRELLWRRHGCPTPGLYGDDGELQCHSCCQDFLRSPANDIEKRFFEIGVEKYKTTLEPKIEEGK